MTSSAGRLAYPNIDEGVSRETLAELDEAGTCAEHWKILFTAGTGFFADACDLFIIGVAAALITAGWHIAGLEELTETGPGW